MTGIQTPDLEHGLKRCEIDALDRSATTANIVDLFKIELTQIVQACGVLASTVTLHPCGEK